MASARSLVAKANNTNVGSLILMALVLGSCIANGEYLGGRRNLAAVAGSATVFDITKNGAVGTGATDSSKAFLNTWIQVCASPTPATLLVPKGEFLAGPVIFAGPCKSKVTVEVQGTITAPPSGYPTPEWFLFEHVDNVVLTGPGTFHGKGEAVWKADGCGQKANCNLPPTSLKFRNILNLDISGISSVNAKAFHMFLVKTKNVNVQNIKLTAPAESPNTDGIHLSNAVNVHIADSLIATGDDCISVGRGSTNVTVERVTCGPGHGLSVGSLGKYPNEENVAGIHFKNCTLKNTDNGLRIKSWGGSSPSTAVDITYEDIMMTNVKNPIIIDQNYGTRGGDSRVAISNVLFKNVRGTTISKDEVQIMCSKAVPCKGVSVVDVELNFVGDKGGHPSSSGGLVGALCTNANVIFGGKLSFPMCPK
ncbi:Exopolygalacturonase [Raphanus sativus]|nr:Exopolygalacturonase [Raphanus sativus]